MPVGLPAPKEMRKNNYLRGKKPKLNSTSQLCRKPLMQFTLNSVLSKLNLQVGRGKRAQIFGGERKSLGGEHAKIYIHIYKLHTHIYTYAHMICY